MFLPVTRKKRIDKQVDELRVRYWFRHLCSELGVHSPRELQRVLEPKLGTISEIRIPNNRYLDYSRGKHVPRQGLVERADNLVPRSAQLFNHVLWSILRNHNFCTASQAELWLKQLDGEIQQVVFASGGRINLHSSRRFLDSLERRASLDALAAITVMMRLNFQAGEHELVREHAYSLLRILLMLGMDFAMYEIDEQMFAIFTARVFPMALAERQQALCFSDYRYLLLSARLAQLAQVHYHYSLGRKPRSINTVKVRILHGDIEGGFMQAYQPRIVPR